VVAIAPVDGQYRPPSRLVPLEDINYLVFHGTHDGDVSSFSGLRTYARIRFSGAEPHFKALVYVHRANHGQWNTVWWPHDRGPRSGRSLDLRGLLEGEEQRRFALVYVTSFMEANLKGRTEYLPLFRDHRVIGGWLPRTMYITQFRESSFRPLATYEEDIDVTTGTSRGVEIRGDSLATWKEDVLPFRAYRESSTASTQENQAVWLGWNNRIAGEDTTRMGPPAAYAFTLPADLPERWALNGATTLDFVLTALDQTPGPRKDPAKEEAGEGPEGRGRRGGGWKIPNPLGFLTRGEREEETKPPLRLSVEAVDWSGNSGKVLLNRYGPVRRPIEIRISRRADQEYQGRSEMVLQSYSIPLADLVEASGGTLDLSTLREVRLLFDESPAGAVVLDEVGFSRMDPAFLRASASGG